MPELTVKIPGRQPACYPIVVAEGALAAAGKLIRERSPASAAIVADENVAKLHLRSLLDAIGGDCAHVHAEPVIVPSGESSKSLAGYGGVVSALLSLGLKRDSLVVAFGGGVTGDLAGFAAATLLRGVDCCQVPTTTLAQVDAAIGGKTGINHAAGKNLVGCFHQPKGVFCDTSVLGTLPAREHLSGMAEIVKSALALDREFFSWLEHNADKVAGRDGEALAEAIFRTASIKGGVVGEDELDRSGLRAVLNLGHTFAHAIERAQGYSGLLHGEAVAVGLIAAGRLSQERTGLDASATDRVRDLLVRIGLPVQFPADTEGHLVDRMASDKKFDASGRKFVLLEGIGRAQTAAGVDAQMLSRAIEAVGFAP